MFERSGNAACSRRTFVTGLALAALPTSIWAAAGPTMDAATEAKLKQVLSGSHRSAANRARDQFRHPLETLHFFGLRQDMAVLEISPGAGWYTEVLAPVLKEKGRYVATVGDAAANPNAAKAVSDFVSRFTDRETYGVVETGVLSSGTGKLSPVQPGSMDMVLTFRNIHNWLAAGTADTMFKVFLDSLKIGGLLGVVEHRAPASVPQDPKAANGYVREDFAIQLAEKAGFKFLAKSEINANPKDTKDYPKGVWTLPPTYVQGDADRAKYAAIGESDRSTLLFQKG